MPRKKEVPGQITLDLESEKIESKKRRTTKKEHKIEDKSVSKSIKLSKPSKEKRITKCIQKTKAPEGYDQIVSYIGTVRNTSIGNLIRVFRISANQASMYIDQLIKDGHLLQNGRVIKKKGR